MLRHLAIQNYALIDNVEIEFKEGLSIITGETGAGKSILLGALGLLTGQRADFDVIKKDTSKCIVEGTFDVSNYNLSAFFEKHNLDYSERSIIRREIRSNGLSRAFINDTPVTLSHLKEMGSVLIDIHSQHQNLLLSNAGFQIEVLDVFAGNQELVIQYQEKYKKYKRLIVEYNDLIEEEKSAKSQQDFIQFQYDELINTKLIPGQLETLERELSTLENAEEIKRSLNMAIEEIGGGEQNILQLIKSVKGVLNSVIKFSPEIEEYGWRIESVAIEILDIQTELESFDENINFDTNRINELNNRIDSINHLLQKHRVKTDKELCDILLSFESILNNFLSIEDAILSKDKEIKILENELGKMCETLNNRRVSKSETLEKKIVEVLASLNMPHAKIKINIASLNEFTENGKDKVQFLFSGNKGGEFNELGKVASGGEISRLMLSLKSVLSRLKSLPTIVFDEIDAGVSGEIASKLGNIMEMMSEKMQVITITHLPQIASKGNRHYEVFKSIRDKQTSSNIRILNKEDRVKEIAKMLSGEKLTEAAFENARALLGR